MNIKNDSLAKKALIQAHTFGEYFNVNVSSEDFTIVTDRKVTGPAKLAREEYWGRIEAKHIFDAKHTFMRMTSILYGGLVHALQLKAIPKCFAFLYPNRSLVGVAPKVRYLCGIQASAILALVVAVQKRHQTHDTMFTQRKSDPVPQIHPQSDCLPWVCKCGCGTYYYV
jgi:hypothetical protein